MFFFFCMKILFYFLYHVKNKTSGKKLATQSLNICKQKPTQSLKIRKQEPNLHLNTLTETTDKASYNITTNDRFYLFI